MSRSLGEGNRANEERSVGRPRFEAADGAFDRSAQARPSGQVRVESLFEHAVLGMYRTTPDGRILAANPSLLRMLGFTDPAELRVRNLEREGFEREYPRTDFKRRIEAEGEVIGLESAWRRRDGTTLWVRENAKAIRNEAGDVLFYEGTVEDVTKEKEALDGLRAGQERLARVIEGTADGIWEWPDVSVDELWWSPRVYELLGYEPGEFVPTSETFESLLHPDDRDAAMAAMQASLDRCGPFESEHRVRTKSGAYRWFQMRGRCFDGGDGRPRCVAGSVRDIAEQKKVAEALQESQQRLHATINAAHLGIWDWDMRTQAVKIGGNHETLLGFAPGEFDGRAQSFWDRVHPEDLPILEKTTAEAAERRLDCALEFRVVWPDGSIHWLAGRGRFQWGPDGRPIRMLGAFQDITQRKRADDARRESEERFRALVENLADGVFAHDLTGRFVMVNKAACDAVGFTREELLAMSVADIDPQSVARADREKFWLAMEPGQTIQTEVAHRRKDGSLCPVEIHLTRLTLQGQPMILGVARDITERKDAVEAIVRSEQKYRRLFNLSPVSIVLIDDQAIIRDVNPRFTELMERDRKAFIGKYGLDLPEVPENMRARLKDAFERRKRGEMVEPHEIPFVTASGTPRVGRLMGTLVRDDCGAFLYVLLMIQDITERKEAERRVARYQDKLKALTTELSLAEERERRRIGMGLHDHVGQALVMTKFSLQALGAKTDVATAQTLGDICGQIDELMDEIRSLSFELSDSVLYEVGFPEAVEAYLVREVQRKHGVTCKLESAGDFPKLDDDMKIVLFRNLRELLTNVIKHAEAEHVWVQLRRGGDDVIVEVEDDGAGFEPDASDAAAVNRHAHFGLFSVREQLACFGGRLEIHSQPNQGACVTMTVSLP